MSKLYSNILKRIVLPFADRIHKTTFAKTYALIEKMNGLTSDEIKSWQQQGLQKLIYHAYQNTDYYKKIFERSGLHPKDIKSQEDLHKLPPLTKEDIRLNFTQLVPKNIRLFPHHKSSTGGSSGDPLIFLLDNKSWSFTNANSLINWERAGYHYGDKHIALGSSSLFVDQKKSLKHKIFYNIKNKIGLNGVNMSAEVCEQYISFIRENKIQFIYGYASAIYLLAQHVISKNEVLKVMTCFPTSEILTDNFRNAIQLAFNCEIIDCYGARDGGITAFSHVKGFFEVGYNCIVNEINVDSSGAGTALLTDLLNYSMPLINYQVGDNLRIDSNQNKGYPYNGQIINEILGRTSDIIYLENGHVLTGPGFTILFKDLPVDYYCIEKVGINSIKCSLKTHPEFKPMHEAIITSTFKKQMGDEVNMTICYIDSIQFTTSGKRKFMVNN